MLTGETCFREYPVHATLAPFVKCIWSVESDRPVTVRRGKGSCLTVAWNWWCISVILFEVISPMAAATSSPRSFVAGQMRNFLEIEPAGRMGLIAVRFHARGAYLFFPKPLSAVTAALVDLENVWGNSAIEWTERIALARGMAARVRIVEDVLLALLRQKDRFDRAVDRCLHLIDSAGGQVRVAQFASEIGLGSRQLTRRFENAVGVSPKEFARVSRFLCGVRRLRRSSRETLTETALECGYFDQAHFNHDFREFAGMTPGEFLVSPNVVF